MPLELCTPATIDFVVMLFINSMEIGGTVWGASLPHFKKKEKTTMTCKLTSCRHRVKLVEPPIVCRGGKTRSRSLTRSF